jgi:hypothetical protein
MKKDILETIWGEVICRSNRISCNVSCLIMDTEIDYQTYWSMCIRDIENSISNNPVSYIADYCEEQLKWNAKSEKL